MKTIVKKMPRLVAELHAPFFFLGSVIRNSRATADVSKLKIDARCGDESVWLTQQHMAELLQVTVPTVNEHLKGIYAEAELSAGATIRKFRIVRTEGKREVAREIEHYNLDAILAVGFRVRSHRGTQFRQWAIGRLTEYLVKGFTMDDERLKNPPGKGQKDYFDEQLERIRDIRSSERRFYQKVLDIYATSVDYTPNTEVSQQFFATVQNKMHWAAHGQTAAEVIHARVDAGKPFMGLPPAGYLRCAQPPATRCEAFSFMTPRSIRP